MKKSGLIIEVCKNKTQGRCDQESRLGNNLLKKSHDGSQSVARFGPFMIHKCFWIVELIKARTFWFPLAALGVQRFFVLHNLFCTSSVHYHDNIFPRTFIGLQTNLFAISPNKWFVQNVSNRKIARKVLLSFCMQLFYWNQVSATCVHICKQLKLNFISLIRVCLLYTGSDKTEYWQIGGMQYSLRCFGPSNQQDPGKVIWTFYIRWSSGRTLTCPAGDPVSIPGQ